MEKRYKKTGHGISCLLLLRLNEPAYDQDSHFEPGDSALGVVAIRVQLIPTPRVFLLKLRLDRIILR